MQIAIDDNNRDNHFSRLRWFFAPPRFFETCEISAVNSLCAHKGTKVFPFWDQKVLRKRPTVEVPPNIDCAVFWTDINLESCISQRLVLASTFIQAGWWSSLPPHVKSLLKNWLDSYTRNLLVACSTSDGFQCHGMVAGLGWKGSFWMNLCVFFMILGKAFLVFGTKKIQLWYIYRLFTILCFKPTLILVWHDTLFLVNEIKVGEGCSQFFHFIFLANFHWLASWQRMYDIKNKCS